MAERSLREVDAKHMLSRLLPPFLDRALPDMPMPEVPAVLACGIGDLSTGAVTKLAAAHPWLSTTPLVVKPDQLIKRRGKAGLVGLRLDWAGVMKWLGDRWGKPLVVEGVTGGLRASCTCYAYWCLTGLEAVTCFTFTNSNVRDASSSAGSMSLKPFILQAHSIQRSSSRSFPTLRPMRYTCASCPSERASPSCFITR